HERGPPGTATPPIHSAFDDLPREGRSSLPHAMTLLASPEHLADPTLVTRLTDILAAEGWRVQEGKQTDIPAGAAAGLTLVAAPRLPRTRLRGTFNALQTAGFPLSLRLDPNLGPREAILLVGPSSVSESHESG